MDLNGDGHGDILSGSYADDNQLGLFQVLWGKGDGKFAKAQTLHGSDGEPLLVFPFEVKDESQFEKMSDAEMSSYFKKTDELFMTRVTAVDLDDDGKLELVVGNSIGTFYLIEGDGRGKFNPQSVQLKTVDGEVLKVNRKSDPCLYDWDGDGDLDLISGSEFGQLQMAENVGSKSKPSFNQFSVLVQGPDTFSRKGGRGPEVYGDAHITRPGASARVWVDDVNGDGKFDLLVGDYVSLRKAADGVDEAKVPELLAAWNKKNGKRLGEIRAEQREAFNERMTLSEDTGKNQKRIAELDAKIEKLVAAEAEIHDERFDIVCEYGTGFVWVYYQTGGAKTTAATEEPASPDAATETATVAMTPLVAKPASAVVGANGTAVQDGIGFDVADADGDGEVTELEMERYLDERIGGRGVPYAKVFERLDADKNDWLSTSEFENRHGAIEHYMGDDFFNRGSGFGAMEPRNPDPGKGFKLVEDVKQSIDDSKIMSAVFYRYNELLKSKPGDWAKVDLDSVPTSIPADVAAELNSVKATDRFDFERVVRATGVAAGGEANFFTGGAVVVSPSGLAITNYHVAVAIAQEGRMVVVTSDGVAHRIVEFIAGDSAQDVALVRLEGENFDCVPLISEVPNVGENLLMVHHSENRFYTFDRGYLMRYPKIDGNPWMEVSMDFAPGGSGCGIFTEKGLLVGLVSTILQGDGPSLTHGQMNQDLADTEQGMGEQGAGEHGFTDADSNQFDGGGAAPLGAQPFLLIKHAVSPQAILKLVSPAKTTDSNESGKSKKTPVVSSVFPRHSMSIEAAAQKFAAPVRVTADGESIIVEAPGYACPAFADINSDGRDDLIVGQYKDGKIKVYLSQDDGTLATGQWLKTGDEVAVVPGIW